MKTQNTNLELNIKTLVELNEDKLLAVEGGSSLLIASIAALLR